MYLCWKILHMWKWIKSKVTLIDTHFLQVVLSDLIQSHIVPFSMNKSIVKKWDKKDNILCYSPLKFSMKFFKQFWFHRDENVQQTNCKYLENQKLSEKIENIECYLRDREPLWSNSLKTQKLLFCKILNESYLLVLLL